MATNILDSTIFRANALNFLSPLINSLGMTLTYRKISELLGRQSVAILMYHRVAEPSWGTKNLFIKTISATPRQFEEQLRFLCSRFKVLSLEKYIYLAISSKKISPNTAIITFDDGYRDNFLYAFPLLKKYRLPATIFLTSGLIGTNRLPWWDRIKWHISQTCLPEVVFNGIGPLLLTTPLEKHKAIYLILREFKLLHPDEIKPKLQELIGQLGCNFANEPREQLFLSWDEVRQMYRQGITFGAHTVSHPNLAKLDTKEIIRELSESKQAIEAEVQTSVRTFAYPFGQNGHFDTRTKELLKNAGFLCALTTLYGRQDLSGDLYQVRRIPLFYYHNTNVFKAKISGIFDRFGR